MPYASSAVRMTASMTCSSSAPRRTGATRLVRLMMVSSTLAQDHGRIQAAGAACGNKSGDNADCEEDRQGPGHGERIGRVDAVEQRSEEGCQQQRRGNANQATEPDQYDAARDNSPNDERRALPKSQANAELA